MKRLSSLLSVSVLLVGFSSFAFAGEVASTPEPRLGLLTALGVGAIVLVGRKMKRR